MSEQTSLLDPELRRDFAPVILQPQQAMLDKVRDDIDEAKSIVIDSDFMAEQALEAAGRLLTVYDALDAQRLATTKPLRDGAAWVNDGYNPALVSLKASSDAYKAKLSAWNREVAKKKAEAEAEARRKQQEAAREAALAQQKAEAEAAELARAAQAAQASGDAAGAAALLEQAAAQSDAGAALCDMAAVVAAAPVHVSTGSASVKGATTAWKARVLDKALLLAYIAQRLAAGDKALLNLIEVNEPNLNAMARMQKADLQLPGVESYPDDGVRVKKSAV